MTRPFWGPGGGFYCSDACKSSRPAKTAAPKTVKSRRRQRKNRAEYTVVYKSYLNSQAWQVVRRRALDAARSRCQDCGLYAEKGLHVHHLTYARFGDELLTDLRVLCEDCHVAIHQQKRKPKLWEGERFYVKQGQMGQFKVVDSVRKRELTRLRSLELAVDFARGADLVKATSSASAQSTPCP